jgi:hypothetical protein
MVVGVEPEDEPTTNDGEAIQDPFAVPAGIDPREAVQRAIDELPLNDFLPSANMLGSDYFDVLHQRTTTVLRICTPS